MMFKGEDLLYSETSPRGEVLQYSRSSGGRSAMGDDPLYDTGSLFTVRYVYIASETVFPQIISFRHRQTLMIYSYHNIRHKMA